MPLVNICDIPIPKMVVIISEGGDKTTGNLIEMGHNELSIRLYMALTI
jgi:hypothetical protein